MGRLRLTLASLLLVAGCGTAEPVWAPESEVQRAIHVHDGPASVALLTVINNRTGEGAHSALLINGSQRIIWDPAGTWWNPAAPERNDVHYGITPRMEEIYIDYHARETFRVVIQETELSRDVADRLISAVQAHGAAPKATCAASTSRILAGIPGFQTIERTWFPVKLMEQFDTLPGISKSVVYDDDDDDNQPLLRQQIAIGQSGI